MAREKKDRTEKTQKRPVLQIGWRRWVAVAVTVLAFASMAWAARGVARYVSADPRFRLSRERPGSLQLRGVVHTSRAKVVRVFANDFERSLYSVPLDERRRRLLAIDWVENASVARVWPDRLVVTIHERQPVAFVRNRGTVLLIDRHGVLLEPPAQAPFKFPILAGVSDTQTEAERGQRARAMLELLQELGKHAADVSEVNAADLENLKVIAKADQGAEELLMGDSNFLTRYQTFLSAYPEVKKRPRKGRVLDLRLDGRVLERE